MRYRWLLILSLAGNLAWSKAGAPEGNGESGGIAQTVKRYIEREVYAGASVDELLLADAQDQSAAGTYVVEFTAHRGGRKIHCEDWKFRLSGASRGNSVVAVERGRCND